MYLNTVHYIKEKVFSKSFCENNNENCLTHRRLTLAKKADIADGE